ncbi:hypothetical protein MTR_8g487670 [Medicago truncatula]|uniref:Uncharacterized protein n=1 Tax=Medicago truncatula TaxID=3880 RepID=A0A072TU23_MEDTR|nr:hypothetical protein MTR_8g487670 [Medicago truncatula]
MKIPPNCKILKIVAAYSHKMFLLLSLMAFEELHQLRQGFSNLTPTRSSLNQRCSDLSEDGQNPKPHFKDSLQKDAQRKKAHKDALP